MNSSDIVSTMMQVPLSLNHLLDRAGILFPDNEVISRLPDKTYVHHTYGDIYRRTRQLAQALKELGLQAGDRVATLCWNCLLYTSPSPRDGLLSRMPSSA